MSYSEVTNRIEEIGMPETFDEIYKNYISSKSKFESIKKEYDLADKNMRHDMYQAKMFMEAAIQRKVAEQDDTGYCVRKVIGKEVVCFKVDGESYSIRYESITF